MSDELDLPDVIELYCENPDDTIICVPRHNLSTLSFYRAHQKDKDKRQYVRADHYRQVSSQMHDYANQIVVLCSEINQLKKEVEALNMLQENL